MYIKNIHVGSPEANTPMNAVYYDFDNPETKLRKSQNAYIDVSTYSGTLNKGTAQAEVVADFAINLVCDRLSSQDSEHSTGDVSDIPQWRTDNIKVVRQLGFGLYDDPESNIIPTPIKYTNSITPLLNRTDIDFTAIEVTSETPQPDNWESERTQNYYYLVNKGTNSNPFYVHSNIPPAYYDWEDLRDYLVAEEKNLYYAVDYCKKIYIGTAEKGASFYVQKGDGLAVDMSGVSSFFNGIFARNAQKVTGYTSYLGYYTGGAIKTSFEDDYDEDDYIQAGGQADGTLQYKTEISNIYGWPQQTNDQHNNKVTDCTLLQFGQVKYNGKLYTGVWYVQYTNEYYAGYYRNRNRDSWSLTYMNWDNPVVYGTEEMQKRIALIRFHGFRADVLDLTIETEEGNVPKEDHHPGTGDYPTFDHRLLGNKGYGVLAGPNEPGFHIYSLDTANFSKLAQTLFQWRDPTAIFTDNMESGGGFIQSWLSTVSTVLLDQRVDPSACVVFARKMPTYVCNNATGSWNIRIGGNFNYGISGAIFSQERLCWDTTTTISVENPTATYLDLDPYVKTTLYLPYIGGVPLQTGSFMNGAIKIGYATDILSGLTSVLVICRNKDGKEKTYGPFVGDPSVQIPLAIQDSNAMGRQFGIAKAATSALLSTASGGMSMLGGLEGMTEALMPGMSGQMITSTGSNSSIVVPNTIMLQMEYPETVDIENTMSTIGVSVYKPGRVRDFFVSDGTPVKYSYVDLSGLTCTEGEARRIESLLKEGIIP